MNQPKSRAFKYTHLAFMFISGSIYPILDSVILNRSWNWNNNLQIRFVQPWFLNTIIFFGMFLLLIPYFIIKKVYGFQKSNDSISDGELFRKTSIPSILFVVSSALQSYALLYMTTTVWQIFQGFQVLFTTLFAVTYRHQKLFLIDWLGLFITVMGICFAGVTSLIRGITDQDQSVERLFFCFILVIISHGIRSFQTIMEEELSHDFGAYPLEIAAFEGAWSIFISLFIAIPITNIVPSNLGAGIYESTKDAILIIQKNLPILGFLVGVMSVFCIYTYCGICVTSFSDAIHRNLYEMVRPFLVLITSTIVYYSTGTKYIGGQIDSYSTLEISGFIVTLFGTLIYNKIIKLPCFVYNEPTSNSALSRDLIP